MTVRPSLSQQHYQVMAVKQRAGQSHVLLYAIKVVEVAVGTPAAVQQVECFYAQQSLLVDSHIRVVKDAYLQEPIAIFTRDCSCLTPDASVAITPQPLRDMLYPRALKEALPTAIPWLGAILYACFILPIILATRAPSTPLKFTFHPLYHLLAAFLTLYPFVLLALERTAWIMPAMFLIYLLQITINVVATGQRNRDVARYWDEVWRQLRTCGT